MLISLSCCVKAAMGGPQGLYATHPAVWRRLTWLRAPVLDTLVLQWKRMLVLWKSVMHFWSTLASSHAWLVMPWQLSATYNLHGSRCYNSKATGGNVDSLGKRMNTGRGVGDTIHSTTPSGFSSFSCKATAKNTGNFRLPLHGGMDRSLAGIPTSKAVSPAYWEFFERVK